MNLVTVTRTRFGKPSQVKKLNCSHDEFKALVKQREAIIASMVKATEFLTAIGAEDEMNALYDAMHDVILSDFEDDEGADGWDAQLGKALSGGING